MKLPKIKFAMLVNFIGTISGTNMSEAQINYLDGIVDIEVPDPVTERVYASVPDLEYLMKAFKNETKIEAIKGLRNMTGMGLKESKDMVEKYWPNTKSAPTIKQEMLSCILQNSEKVGFLLKDFNADELDTIRQFIESFNEYKTTY